MTTQSFSFTFGRALSGAAAALVGLVAMIMLVLATLAVTFVGVVIALAALAVRLMPGPRRRDQGPPMLEARRTPEGWVAEPARQ